jgi:enoyl-CoA hydratase
MPSPCDLLPGHGTRRPGSHDRRAPAIIRRMGPDPDPRTSVAREHHADVAVLRLDDGKVNALSSRTIGELEAALDWAHGARAIAIVGRPGVFSAGLDLHELGADRDTQRALRDAFMALALRVFTLPIPVVVGCTGHALAGGAALLLAADRRIGTDGPFRIGFNEVASGFALSHAAVELIRYRLPMPWFETIVTGSTCDPVSAVAWGLLDAVVADPVGTAVEAATELAALEPRAFAVVKQSARRDAAHRVAAALDRSGPRRADTP